MNLFKVWGSIIANTFKGFEGVKKETGVLFPFLIIIMLTVINLLILTPVMQKITLISSYGGGIVTITAVMLLSVNTLINGVIKKSTASLSAGHEQYVINRDRKKSLRYRFIL